jgi:hypothetical protein
MKPHWCGRKGGPRRWATDGRSRLNNEGVDLVRLPRPVAHDRVLRMPIEACVVRPDVAVDGEAAAVQKNRERRYDEESLHLLRPLKPRPRAHS